MNIIYFKVGYVCGGFMLHSHNTINSLNFDLNPEKKTHCERKRERKVKKITENRTNWNTLITYERTYMHYEDKEEKFTIRSNIFTMNARIPPVRCIWLKTVIWCIKKNFHCSSPMLHICMELYNLIFCISSLWNFYFEEDDDEEAMAKWRTA